MSRPLVTSGTANFVSDGVGGTVARIQLGPQRFGESWDVTSASISASGAAIPACRMYRNSESPSSFIDGTSTASLNVTNIETQLGTLEKLIFVFTGGTMSASATVVLNGTSSYAGEA